MVNQLKKFARESTMVNAIIVVAVLLAIMCCLKPSFLSLDNFMNMSTVLAVNATVAFSMMVIVGMGGMNISVGTTGAMCAVLAGYAMESLGASTPVALLIGIGSGLLAGLVNGLLVCRFGGAGVAFFLVTLATSYMYKGIVLVVTEGMPVYKINSSFLRLGSTRLFGMVPLSFVYMIILALFSWFLFSKMKIGRQMLAFGANYKAAKLYGVSNFKVVIYGCMLAGFFSAVGGMLGMIRVMTAQPNMGSDWMLMAFAATLIGGTSLSGGRINVIGTILGAFAMVIIDNALVYLMVDTYWTQLIYGFLILASVLLEEIRSRTRQRRIADGSV